MELFHNSIEDTLMLDSCFEESGKDLLDVSVSSHEIVVGDSLGDFIEDDLKLFVIESSGLLEFRHVQEELQEEERFDIGAAVLDSQQHHLFDIVY